MLRPARSRAEARRRSRRASAGSPAAAPVERSGPSSGGAPHRPRSERRRATKRSCSVTTSPSMPAISVICVTRREPSTSREMCTSRSKPPAICSRIALTGSSMPAISTSISSRCSASRAEFAWTVVSDPSWPVFIAWSMSSVSAPRTSPTMIRSGRMRSALRTRSRMRTSPSPSTFGGRDSSETTCRCSSRSSAASSTVTIRSVAGNVGRDGVQQCRLTGACTAGDEDVELPANALREEVGRLLARAFRARSRSSSVSASRANFRIVSDGPRERERRNDRVDAAAVGQTGVDHRR